MSEQAPGFRPEVSEQPAPEVARWLEGQYEELTEEAFYEEVFGPDHETVQTRQLMEQLNQLSADAQLEEARGQVDAAAAQPPSDVLMRAIASGRPAPVETVLDEAVLRATTVLCSVDGRYADGEAASETPHQE